jgi:hypothetical protein
MDLLPVEYAVFLTRKSDIDRGEEYLTGNRSITVLLYNKIHVLINQ